MQQKNAQNAIRDMLKDADPSVRDAFMLFASMCDAFSAQIEEATFGNLVKHDARAESDMDAEDDGGAQ